MAKPIKALSSTVVVQVGGGPSPWRVADMHCSSYLFVSLTMWLRSSGVNRVKNVVVGSPKVMDGPTGSENSRMLTAQGVSGHCAFVTTLTRVRDCMLSREVKD